MGLIVVNCHTINAYNVCEPCVHADVCHYVCVREDEKERQCLENIHHGVRERKKADNCVCERVQQGRLRSRKPDGSGAVYSK